MVLTPPRRGCWGCGGVVVGLWWGCGGVVVGSFRGVVVGLLVDGQPAAAGLKISPRGATGTSPKITIGNTTGTSPRITIGNTTGTSRKLL